jgi:hypothetical protein
MENINSSDPSIIEDDFFTINIQKNQKSIKTELTILSKLTTSKSWERELDFLKSKLAFSSSKLKIENKRRWENRASILDQAIYKMKFVKIEFISRMRDLSLALRNKYEDEVSTYAAAPTRNNQIKFPHDRVIWSDELFNMTAQVENLCLQGLK